MIQLVAGITAVWILVLTMFTTFATAITLLLH